MSAWLKGTFFIFTFSRLFRKVKPRATLALTGPAAAQMSLQTIYRREMISNMVRKNHQAEEAAAAALRKHRNPPSLFNNRSVIVGGVVAVASIFAYYYFRQ